METPLLFECSYLFNALSLSLGKRMNWCWCYLVTMRCCCCAGSGDGSLRAWSTQSGAEVSFIFPIYCRQVLELGSWRMSLVTWTIKVTLCTELTLKFQNQHHRCTDLIPLCFGSPSISLLLGFLIREFHRKFQCWYLTILVADICRLHAGPTMQEYQRASNGPLADSCLLVPPWLSSCGSQIWQSFKTQRVVPRYWPQRLYWQPPLQAWSPTSDCLRCSENPHR